MAEKKKENKFAKVLSTSLPGTNIGTSVNITTKAIVKDIEINLIDFDPQNDFLNGYDDADLETLGNAMETTGQETIIGVYKKGDGRYLCYSGHSRILNDKRKGKTKITCQISPMPEDEDKRTETLILMNVQRDNSRPLYIARQASEMKKILRKRNFKGNCNKEVGRLLGFSVSQIIRYEKILDLPEEFQELCKLKNFPFTTFDKTFFELTEEQRTIVLTKTNQIINEKNEITQNELAMLIKEAASGNIQNEKQEEKTSSKPGPKGKVYKSVDAMVTNIKDTIELNDKMDVYKIKDRDSVKENAEAVIKLMKEIIDKCD